MAPSALLYCCTLKVPYPSFRALIRIRFTVDEKSAVDIAYILCLGRRNERKYTEEVKHFVLI